MPECSYRLLKSLMVTSNASTPSGCLLAVMRPNPLLAITVAVPSVLSRYLLGQWRINHGQHRAPKIENEKNCFSVFVN